MLHFIPVFPLQGSGREGVTFLISYVVNDSFRDKILNEVTSSTKLKGRRDPGLSLKNTSFKEERALRTGGQGGGDRDRLNGEKVNVQLELIPQHAFDHIYYVFNQYSYL